ncbi:MAG: GH92 family glycosyl hydrolase [Saprospiraceae bacterium]
MTILIRKGYISSLNYRLYYYALLLTIPLGAFKPGQSDTLKCEFKNSASYFLPWSAQSSIPEIKSPKSSLSLLDFVNPFIGTGGHGHTFPGAAYPFGMMQLSPDTRLEGWDGCSGYHDSDSFIYGFSHTHLSGTGVPDYCDVLFMPGIGDSYFNNGFDGKAGYRSAFKKASEKANPGFYEVYLEKYKTRVQLTVGKRTGLHHYIFGESSGQWIMIDLKHRDPLILADFTNISDYAIEGFRNSTAWARNQKLYFKAIFNKKIINFKFSEDSLKLILFFENNGSRELYTQVGISAVDAEGASENLASEFNKFDFKLQLQKTQEAWIAMLGRIEIQDTVIVEKTIFYSALYHTMIHPSLFQDVDGRYLGMDFKIHSTIADDHYTVFSLWDTYRSTHPLYQWIYPDFNSKFIRTFLRQYQECGHLPVWELAGNETWCMIGNHSIPVIANAFHHKVFDFDTALAKEAIQNTILKGINTGMKFMQKGFIASNEESESVSKTIENSLDFAAAASIQCKGLENFSPESYKNLYNPESGFYQARWNNQFIQPFDPLEVNHHYTEANSYQYVFGAHHDIEGMKDMFMLSSKGKDKQTELKMRLDDLFFNSSEMTGRVQPDITGLIGQYAHGNEPSHHLAYLYNDAGVPQKTQELVRKIKTEFYKLSPDGLIGNEDCGQMSSWYVFSALGFYPVNSFDASYAIGIPSFENVIIKVPNRKPVQLRTIKSNHNEYVQHFSINGNEVNSNFKIQFGDQIEFKLGPTSFTTPQFVHQDVRSKYLIQPYLKSGQRVFKDSTMVRLANVLNMPMEYCYDTNTSTHYLYDQPLNIKDETRLYFRIRDNYIKTAWLYSDFIRKPQGIQMNLMTDYANQYAASGKEALIDGLTGSMDFRDGIWQGYQGKDLKLQLEFSEERTWSHLGIRFLQDQSPWIMMPSQVEFKISEDGKHFERIDLIKNTIAQKTEGAILNEFKTEQNFRCRFIQIIAKNSGLLPDWHPGAGGATWLFADEIIIK